MFCLNEALRTCDGGEVGRTRHGHHRGGDVFGLDPIQGHPVQVRRVHILVVVPPEPVEGHQKQLGLPLLPVPRRLPADADRHHRHEEDLLPHLHLHSDCRELSQNSPVQVSLVNV